jgi:SAM-dependent methyltransferase
MRQRRWSTVVLPQSGSKSAAPDCSRDNDARALDHRVSLWLFLAMLPVFLFVQEGAITGYDGGTMYEVTRSMAEQGDVAISEEWNTLPGRKGLEYSRYGLGLSLVAFFPYVLVSPIANLSESRDVILEAAAGSAMAFISAGLVVAIYLLARRLGAGARAAVLVGVGSVIGTFMLPYTKEFFAEPLTALLLVVAFERLLADSPIASGFALGLAVLTRAQNIVLAPLILLIALRRRGLAGALGAVASMTLGVAVTLAYNHVRFGSPFEFGYEDVGFTTPFFEGATGLLFNPLKSIFIFTPVVMLLPIALAHLWRTNRDAFTLITGNLFITFAITATWFAWHGGWGWGPRLLIPALIPALAAIGSWVSTTRRRKAAAGLFATGLMVSVPALIVPTQAQQLEVPPVPPSTHVLDTQPLSSPSVHRQFALVPSTVRYSIENRYGGPDDGFNYLRYLSLWQIGAARVLGPRALAAAVGASALLLGMALVALRKLRPLLGERRREPAPRAGGYEGKDNLEAMESAHNYHAFLASTILSRADPSRPQLDFGAGTGTHARILRDRGVVVKCVEPDSELASRLRLEGFEVAARPLEFGQEAFETVYSLNVLEHIEDDVSAMRELFTVLRPGGRLILYVPAFSLLFSEMDRRVGHFRRYRARSLRGKVEAAGLRVVECRYVDSLGFVAALLYRLLGRDGNLNERSISLYDRFAFPVSRVLDRLVSKWWGKNLLLVATRD